MNCRERTPCRSVKRNRLGGTERHGVRSLQFRSASSVIGPPISTPTTHTSPPHCPKGSRSHVIRTESSHVPRRASLATAAAGVVGSFPLTNIVQAATRGDKLRCAVIGCGGRGMTHVATAAGQQFVAIADTDERRHDAVCKELQKKGRDATKLKTFTDYRPLFDKLGKQLDAVFIATPNHQHALPSLIAMQLGLGVYCEKPLCHDIAEARRLAEAARRHKVPTQMGNQGHCGEGYRRLCEYVWAGVIGPIKETHSWCDRSNGGVGPRPAAEHPPASLHWDEWIGPAPYREFHKDLHPHEWHGWYDFGNGSLGNMACHVLDGVFWSLKLGHPLCVVAESVSGGSDERYPVGTRIRWDFPARRTARREGLLVRRPPEGEAPQEKSQEQRQRPLPAAAAGRTDERASRREIRLQRHAVRGRKGHPLHGHVRRRHAAGRQGGPRHAATAQVVAPARRYRGRFPAGLPRGKTDTAAAFDYSARLTEFALLGNLAQHAGENRLVEWDGPHMKVTNLPELNAWIDRPYRKGWQVG